MPDMGEKSSVDLSAATIVPGGGASGSGGTISTRVCGLCGAPDSRGPEGEWRIPVWESALGPWNRRGTEL